MSILFRSLAPLALAAALALLSACGGGSASTTGDPTGQPSPEGNGGSQQSPGDSPSFAAVATSAHHASLAWTTTTGSESLAIERQREGAAAETIGTVAATAGGYVDAGLAAATAYTYRLRGADGAVIGEAHVTTGTEEPVSTGVGAPMGDAVSLAVPAEGRLRSADGRIAIDVPQGALPAGASIGVQPVGNNAPDGLEDGFAVSLPALPSAPLTLTLSYGAGLDLQADGMRIAVQQADHSWLSLPVLAIDKTQRVLSAQLPTGVLAAAATPTARPAAQGRAHIASAGVSVVFHVAKYLAFHLEPARQTLPVKGTQRFVPYARVRGYETTISTCDTLDDLEICVGQPVFESREMPFLNQKAGYTRQWLVFLDEGGSPDEGTAVPQGSTGAVYTAPSQVPATNPVIVSFVSTRQGSGRTVTLSAPVRIVDDVWTGTMSAQDGPSSAGTTIVATAWVTWRRNAAGDSATTAHYQAEGRLDASVTDDDCSLDLAPPSQPLSTDVQLQSLDIDNSTSPATYHARLITFWNATLSASCPQGSTSRPTLAGWGWDVQGTLSADGQRIEGEAVVDGHQLAWSFSR